MLHNDPDPPAGEGCHWRSEAGLKGVWKGNARIIHATTITMDRINLPMAKLDTGLSLEECQRLIKSLYKNRPGINWKTQPLDYMVLEYVKESKEPSLF